MTQEEVLCRVFDLINVGKLDMSTFDNRIKYQKIIYLLQSTGLSLGYGFKWYLKGPYSHELAQSLYYISDFPQTYKNSKNLTFKQNDLILEKLQAFNSKFGYILDNPSYLETLTSIHYINMSTFTGHGSKKELEDKLFDIKPKLKQLEGVDGIIDFYLNFGCFNNCLL